MRHTSPLLFLNYHYPLFEISMMLSSTDTFATSFSTSSSCAAPSTTDSSSSALAPPRADVTISPVSLIYAYLSGVLLQFWRSFHDIMVIKVNRTTSIALPTLSTKPHPEEILPNSTHTSRYAFVRGSSAPPKAPLSQPLTPIKSACHCESEVSSVPSGLSTPTWYFDRNTTTSISSGSSDVNSCDANSAFYQKLHNIAKYAKIFATESITSTMPLEDLEEDEDMFENMNLDSIHVGIRMAEDLLDEDEKNVGTREDPFFSMEAPSVYSHSANNIWLRC